MEKIKKIIKIIIITFLIILTIIFMIKLLPFIIIFVIIYSIINYFKNKNKVTIIKEKKKTKDLEGIDLALHISEKTK